MTDSPSVSLTDADVPAILSVRERVAMHIDPTAWKKIEPLGTFDVYRPYRERSLKLTDTVLAALTSNLTFDVIAAGHGEMPWVSRAVARRTFLAMIQAIKDNK